MVPFTQMVEIGHVGLEKNIFRFPLLRSYLRLGNRRGPLFGQN